MAGKNVAASYNSENMESLISALGSCLTSVESDTTDLRNHVAELLRGEENGDIKGKDAAAVYEAARQIQTQVNTSIALITTMKSAISNVAEKMNIAMDWAGKSTKDTADQLIEASNKIKAAKDAK